MRLSIKTKQVAGVTTIVGLAVVILSALYLSSLARLTLEESRARAELLANAIYHRAREVVAKNADPYSALRTDDGLRSILESSAYSRNVTFAAIADTTGAAIAHSDSAGVGQKMPVLPSLISLLDEGSLAQLRSIYSRDGRTFEVRRSLLKDDVEFGSIRIGLSMLLTRDEIDKALRPALLTALGALAVASIVAWLLAQVLLRPIHVIRSGLTRLGQGESGVVLDLPQQDEFGELGGYFNAVSAQLSADRTQLAGQKAKLESLLGRLSSGVAHEIRNPLNATMIHLELLKQQLSKRAESVDAAASPGTALPDTTVAMGHVSVIAGQMRRLDEVVQGFLKFTKREDLQLRPVSAAALLDELIPIVKAEAAQRRIDVRTECPTDLPAIRGDSGMLQQAFLNLALNAVQAMPDGGRLRIACRTVPGSRIEVMFEDTGIGIPAENLERIFDLYFTTKEHGSGIGLSMVYRTVQLHDGDIEVESVPGHGTTFRVMLSQA